MFNPPSPRHDERGIVLVLVLFVLLILMVLGTTMLIMGQTQSAVAVNELDYVKALGHAEAGVAWAKTAMVRAGDMTDVLDGPDDLDDAETLDDDDWLDDHLIGLRDLSLTSSAQLTASNDNRKSAIVQRDFFGTNQTFELLRLDTSHAVKAVGGGSDTRANLYVRVDDNHDDDPDDPANDDPLVDNDGVVSVTVVSEYPVFVDGSGIEMASNGPGRRGAARRAIAAKFGTDGLKLPALASDGPIDISGTLKLCGACGSLHTNSDLTIGGTANVCQDATASGRLTGTTTGIAGHYGANEPRVEVPVINPYDSIFMPTPDTFNTSGDASLPAGLRCPKASAADPGANKFFAFVSDDNQGRIFKAYWDFTNGGWSWVEIANLAGGDVILDDCGRVKFRDANFATGSAGEVNDGNANLFYGFKGDRYASAACTACGLSDADKSLCATRDNDFGAQTVLGGPQSLPGSKVRDAVLDSDPAKRPNVSLWDFAASRVWSPLYGAVVWIYGNARVSGNPANFTAVDFRCSATAGCVNTSMPNGLWRLSVIAVGDITVSGQANLGPAAPDRGYHFSLIAGRDLKLSGNPNEQELACTFGCATSPPTKISNLAGIFAAHEQIEFSGSPNMFGIVLAENAIDCSPTVWGRGRGITSLGGTPRIMYDCDHPPNPWDRPSNLRMLSWREIE